MRPLGHVFTLVGCLSLTSLTMAQMPPPSSGSPVGASETVSLQPGHSALLVINGNTLSAGQRIQWLPTITPITVLSAAALPPNQCVAFAEVIDTASAATTSQIRRKS